VKFIAGRTPRPDLLLKRGEGDGAGAEDGGDGIPIIPSPPERPPHPDLWGALHSHAGEEGAPTRK